MQILWYMQMVIKYTVGIYHLLPHSTERVLVHHCCRLFAVCLHLMLFNLEKCAAIVLYTQTHLQLQDEHTLQHISTLSLRQNKANTHTAVVCLYHPGDDDRITVTTLRSCNCSSERVRTRAHSLYQIRILMIQLFRRSLLSVSRADAGFSRPSFPNLQVLF